MSIDHFPPELLKIIFSNEKIPLKQRIALRGVCSHWLEVIDEHVLKKTTELVFSSDKSDGTESNCLPYKDELVPLFVHLFPKLTNLFIHFNRESFKAPYTALPRLLSPLSTTLTTLKLNLSNIGHHFKYHDPQWITHFTTALNSLSTLTVLHLNNADDITHTFPQLLPTFSRLQQFYCSSFPYSTDLVPSEFWQTITANQPLSTLTTLEIAQTLVDNGATVADLVATFPSLQSLKLHLHFDYDWFDNNHLDGIFPHLASLQHLTELNLVGLYFFADEPLPLPSPTDQRLTQVKKLTLTYSNYLYELTTLLVAWFPSLEVLHLHDNQYWVYLFEGPNLTSTTLRNLARLEQLIELNLSNEKNLLILTDGNLDPPLPTERPIIGLKRLSLLGVENVQLDRNTSALVAWFPSLQYLKFDMYGYYEMYLTTAILRDICQLKSLIELELPLMWYEKLFIEPPLPTDRPLACLKELTLEIFYPSKDFDASYFCSTVTAWFPDLEVLDIIISFNCDNYEGYKTLKWARKASEAIRKGFDSSVKLNIYIE